MSMVWHLDENEGPLQLHGHVSWLVCEATLSVHEGLWVNPEYAGVARLFFVNWTPIFDHCVVGWGSKNERHKYKGSNEIGLRLPISLGTQYWPQLGGTRFYSTRFHQHPLPITIAKSWEVRFSIWFLLMIHCGYINAMEILSCKYSQ